MDVVLITNQCSFMLASLIIQPLIVDKIKEGQASDADLQKVRVEVIKGEKPEFNLVGDGTLRFGTRLCVPNLEEINFDKGSLYTLLSSPWVYEDVQGRLQNVLVDWYEAQYCEIRGAMFDRSAGKD